jgi:putative ABC transport system permease protein
VKRLMPVISIVIAAFFAYSTVLAKQIAEQMTMKGSQLNEIFSLLGAFVTIAMVAAALVSTSTFRIVFTQHMRELALLRAIGADRGQLARKLIGEGARTGLLASITGVALAFLVSRAVPLVGLVTPDFQWQPAVIVVIGAFVLTTLAVLGPAVSAARVSPLEALRTSATQDTNSRIGRARWILGLAMTAGAVALLIKVALAAAAPKPDTDDLLLLTILSATLAFGALIALGPALIAPLLRIVGALVGKAGPVGRLAVGGVGGAPRRAASVTVVVALGVSLIIGMLVGSETLRNLGKAEMASAYPADLEITGDLTKLPADGLRDVLPYRRLEVEFPGLIMQATDLDMRALRAVGDFRIESGSLDALAPGQIVLPARTAARLGVTAGQQIVMTAGEKSVTVTVAATVYSQVPLAGVVIDPSEMDALGGGEPEGVLANGTIQPTPGLEMESLADRRAGKEDWFATLVYVALGLLMLTVLIAVVGVGSTTALSVMERTRESGLLRAIGLSRPELRAMVTIEAGVYGVIGALIGLALGIPYAWLAVLSLGLDWPLQIPVMAVLLVVVILAGLTALAGLLPARRAANVSPVAALNTV